MTITTTVSCLSPFSESETYVMVSPSNPTKRFPISFLGFWGERKCKISPRATLPNRGEILSARKMLGVESICRKHARTKSLQNLNWLVNLIMKKKSVISWKRIHAYHNICDQIVPGNMYNAEELYSKECIFPYFFNNRPKWHHVSQYSSLLQVRILDVVIRIERLVFRSPIVTRKPRLMLWESLHGLKEFSSNNLAVLYINQSFYSRMKLNIMNWHGFLVAI